MWHSQKGGSLHEDLATGDTHGNFERFRPEYFPEGQELTKEDVVLQLGDFGGVWFGDERDDEALDWLKGLPFTVAFVSGNHENYDALVKYPIRELARRQGAAHPAPRAPPDAGAGI